MKMLKKLEKEFTGAQFEVLDLIIESLKDFGFQAEAKVELRSQNVEDKKSYLALKANLLERVATIRWITSSNREILFFLSLKERQWKLEHIVFHAVEKGNYLKNFLEELCKEEGGIWIE